MFAILRIWLQHPGESIRGTVAIWPAAAAATANPFRRRRVWSADPRRFDTVWRWSVGFWRGDDEWWIRFLAARRLWTDKLHHPIWRWLGFRSKAGHVIFWRVWAVERACYQLIWISTGYGWVWSASNDWIRAATTD